MNKLLRDISPKWWSVIFWILLGLFSTEALLGQLEVGDISPDSPPDWLIGYPFIYNKNKFSRWSKLWDDFSEFDRLLKDIIFIRNNNDLASMKKNQWLKIINSNSTTFSMVKNSAIKSHAHQDEGSFFYVYKKLPIIIDPGLKNYLKDKIMSKG